MRELAAFGVGLAADGVAEGGVDGQLPARAPPEFVKLDHVAGHEGGDDLTVAAGIEDAIFSARAAHRRLVVNFGHGAVIIANATLQVGVFRSYGRNYAIAPRGDFVLVGNSGYRLSPPDPVESR